MDTYDYQGNFRKFLKIANTKNRLSHLWDRVEYWLSCGGITEHEAIKMAMKIDKKAFRLDCQ